MTTRTIETSLGAGSALAGSFMVLLAAAGFSAKAVLVKLAYAYSPRLDAVTLMSLRMSLSLPFFVLAAMWSHRNGGYGRLTRYDLTAVIGLGVLGFYLAGYLDFTGLRYITAGLERLILFLYPTLVVFLSALLHRRPMGRRERTALVLSYVGIAVVVDGHVATGAPHLLLGSALVFGAAVAFALYILISEHMVRRLGSVRLTAYVMSAACLATAVHFGLSHHPSALVLPPEVYAVGLIMAVFSTVLPAFLLSAGMRRIGAGATSIISSIGPVITLGLAYLLLGEPLTPGQCAGTALVIGGVIIAGRTPRRRNLQALGACDENVRRS